MQPVSSPPRMPPKPSTARSSAITHMAVVDRVGLAVEACEFLALAAEPGADGAGELVGVVDVQRAAAVEADVVGDVDQRVDGAQADGLEALLHPGRRGAVADAPDVAAGEAGAGVARFLGEVELDVDGAVVVALDAADLLLGLELAEAGGGEVAGDAAHARAVGPVGGELHVQHGIGEAQDVGVALTQLVASLASSSMMPWWSSESSSSRSETSMPFETTPRTGLASSVILVPGM